MQKNRLADILGDIWNMGEDSKLTQNVMEELAMKCNRCGTWIRNKCAVNTAMKHSAGMIQHANCSGIFETP